jgi:Mg-chelatase subunit ChlD
MEGQQIKDAKTAALTFIDHMDLAGSDQGSVVSFAGQASLDQKLTHDRGRIDAAIDAIGADGGTNIAAGVIAATRELTSSRHNPAAPPVMILLTDGLAKGEEAAAMEAAAAAKAQGIRVITIGLGHDVNESLLRAMASADTDYYFAPSSSDLEAIYEAIAWVLTCSDAPAAAAARP